MSFTDSFTGTDGSSPAGWTQTVPGWQIQSNRLQFAGASYSEIYRLDGAPGDCTLEWDMDLSAAGLTFALFGVRVVDANNYVYFQLNASDILSLHTWVAGVDTLVATDTVTRCGSGAAATHCKIQFVGNSVSFTVTGGVQTPGTFGPNTVSALASTGAGVVFGWNNSKTGDYIDNVVYTSASAGASGSLAKTNANDTSSAAGTTTVKGSLAKTGANDTSSAAGKTTIKGSLARTNANDTSSASGSIGSPVSGSLARTNANDTGSASGTTTVKGSSARTNASDTVSAAGTTTVLGTAARANANDAVSASGSIGSAVGGSLGTTNANDAGSGSGTTSVVGSVSAQANNDAVAALGDVPLGTVTGSASVTNADDTSQSVGGGQGAGEYETKKKRRFVTKVGDRLVAFNDPNVLEMLHPPELQVPVKEIKAKAKVHQQEKQVSALIKAERYDEALQIYEDLQDEEDVEMLLLAL